MTERLLSARFVSGPAISTRLVFRWQLAADLALGHTEQPIEEPLRESEEERERETKWRSGLVPGLRKRIVQHFERITRESDGDSHTDPSGHCSRRRTEDQRGPLGPVVGRFRTSPEDASETTNQPSGSP